MKINKKMLFGTIILFAVSASLYFINNIILNMANLVSVIVFVIIINRKNLSIILDRIVGCKKKKHNKENIIDIQTKK